MIEKKDVQGRREIVSWVRRHDDGRVTYPMGESLAGFVQYDERHMSCMISRTPRADFVTGRQWDAADGMLYLEARLEAGTPQARTVQLAWRRA